MPVWLRQAVWTIGEAKENQTTANQKTYKQQKSLKAPQNKTPQTDCSGHIWFFY